MQITKEFLKTLDNDGLIDTLREYHARKLQVTPELRAIINKAAPFCSKDKLRPQLYDVLIDVPSNGLKCKVVATDAHIMYKCEYKLGYIKEQGKYLINPSMLKKYKADVTIYVLEVGEDTEVKEAHFYMFNEYFTYAEFICSTPVGREYPNYEDVIPTDYFSQLRMDTDYLHGASRSLEALKHVDGYFSEAFGVQFYMDYEKEALRLVPELDTTDKFKNSVQLEFPCADIINGIVSDGLEAKKIFKLNIAKVLIAVKALKEKDSRLNIWYDQEKSGKRAVIFHVKEGEQVLLMPIMDAV